MHDFLTVGAAAPLQEAAIAGTGDAGCLLRCDSPRSTRRSATFSSAACDAAGLTFTEPEGAYYVMVDVSEFGVTDDTAFCEWLAREVGVAAVPGSSFFREPVHHLIRFHFAKQESTLREAIPRLSKLREKASNRR